ncbi:MAG: hypothetical protein Q4C30_03750 [Bacteroidia bacterium]|nr:hypothetical protein [Bacteroidia bacterium]
MCTIQIKINERSAKGRACIAVLDSLNIEYVRVKSTAKTKKKKNSIDKALDDIKAGRTTRYENTEALMADILK